MIKYLGSKRRLVPVLGDLLERAGATTALDLFTGTTRVAQEWKRRGAHVIAVDSARYAAVLARCFIQTDACSFDRAALEEAISQLQALPGIDGYVTETFAHQARFFQPTNARRIDAMREHLERHWAGHPFHPVLLTSLLQAADRVDSTTGLQMAYLKQWAPRSYQPLTLRVPALLGGPGAAVQGDATEVVANLPEVDLAYLDPPYNQHRYFTNYHVWETLVAWDAPAYYGVACKRIDARDPATKSVFNDRRRAPAALARLIEAVRAAVVVISASNEGWIPLEELVAMAEVRGAVGVLAFDSRRYVGAQIGIHNPQGKKVGRVGSTRNTEYVIVAGAADLVARMIDGYPEWSAGQEAARRSAGQEAARRSAGQEAQPDPAIRVVDVRVDQDQALSGAEDQLAAEDREAERGADQDRKQVVGAVAGGAVTMPVAVGPGEEPLEELG